MPAENGISRWLQAVRRSKLFYILQDVAVFSKGLVASLAIVAMLQDGELIQCSAQSFDYDVKQEGMVRAVSSAINAGRVFSSCGPEVSIETPRKVFLIFVFVNLFFFCLAIGLKQTSAFSRHSLKISVAIAAVSFLLTIGKAAVVYYLPFLNATYDCSDPRFISDRCISKTPVVNVSTLDPTCWRESTKGCEVEVACTSQCVATFNSEIFVLVLVFFLSFFYVCYLMYEYHLACSERGGESRLLLQSGYDGDPSESVSINDALRPEAAATRRSRRFYFRVLQDCSALAKLVVTATSLSIFLANSANTIKCQDVVVSPGLGIPSPVVFSTCQPQSNASFSSYTFLTSTIYFVVFFSAAIVVEKKQLLRAYAGTVSVLLLATTLLAYFFQLFIVMSVGNADVVFACRGSSRTVEVGLCRSLTFNSSDVGYEPDTPVVCEDVCKSSLPSAMHVLSINLTLSLTYVWVIVLSYYTQRANKGVRTAT